MIHPANAKIWHAHRAIMKAPLQWEQYSVVLVDLKKKIFVLCRVVWTMRFGNEFPKLTYNVGTSDGSQIWGLDVRCGNVGTFPRLNEFFGNTFSKIWPCQILRHWSPATATEICPFRHEEQLLHLDKHLITSVVLPCSFLHVNYPGDLEKPPLCHEISSLSPKD